MIIFGVKLKTKENMSEIRTKRELTNIIFQEPCLETLRKMPNEVLDCVITSPPYWQLRDYGYDGQWGLEPTSQEYLDHLWEMMDLIYQKLKPSGTVWINLGDTYGTQSGGLRCKNTFDPKNPNATSNVIIQPKTIHKSLLLIPHRFAIGCIDRGWIVRNDIVWAKKNSLPESVKDRFSKKHEYMFFMVKNKDYYFDLESIKDDYLTKENRQNGVVRNRAFKYDSKMNNKKINPNAPLLDNVDESEAYKILNRKKNPGDVSDFWDINTKPSKLKHYASYNSELIQKPILAGCPKGGLIYDPFMGTGSTAESSLEYGRLFIGSEMSESYCKIANERLINYQQQLTIF